MISAALRVDLVVLVAVGVILSNLLYTLTLFWLSRFNPALEDLRAPLRPMRTGSRISMGTGFHVVFVIPCLNEETVITGCLSRLAELTSPNVHVVVVDDGSDDRTAARVRRARLPWVHLVSRTLPNARQGKGEALNAAIRHIHAGHVIDALDPQRTIICVVDADGRMEEHALRTVLPLFSDPALGAVQIGVRIGNRDTSLLARMQDIEFAVYTGVYQRGRRHLHSVTLGGNGQFVRLAALDDLGPSPWSRSLTEDLDLGIRLLLAGWKTDYCSRTAVHQQGLVDLRSWVRQRARWFQGHLQSWKLLGGVLLDLRGIQRADVFYVVASSLLLVLGSFLALGSLAWVLGIAVSAIAGDLQVTWWWLSAYVVSFGPALLFAADYWHLERLRGVTVPKAIALLHLYVVYSTLWYFAGAWAVVRTVLGVRGWSKTERVDDAPTPLRTSSSPRPLVAASERSAA